MTFEVNTTDCLLLFTGFQVLLSNLVSRRCVSSGFSTRVHLQIEPAKSARIVRCTRTPLISHFLYFFCSPSSGPGQTRQEGETRNNCTRVAESGGGGAAVDLFPTSCGPPTGSAEVSWLASATSCTNAQICTNMIPLFPCGNTRQDYAYLVPCVYDYSALTFHTPDHKKLQILSCLRLLFKTFDVQHARIAHLSLP